MRDPHVVTLRYRVETDETTSYVNPPPLNAVTDTFSLYLADNVLTITMTKHVSSVDLAKTEVEELLRSWELDVALRLGPGELHFVFDDAEVIDRNPLTDGTRVIELSSAAVAIASMSAKLHVGRSKYPPPPSRFRTSPDVETMWHRYQGYRDGREPLLSMAYFCFTLVTARAGTLKEAASQIAVDQKVLKKLSEITSIGGDRSTARKLSRQSNHRALTAAETNWIESAVTTIIRRAGEADPQKSLPTIFMKDLPSL
jgi:hypothetical protein